MVVRFFYTLVLAATFAACTPTRGPQLRVVGIHENSRREVVFLQVTNPARSAMRITKLSYTFAADGHTVAAGVVRMSREIEPGAAAVVEVPYDTPASTLSGQLTAELDQITRVFDVTAQLPSH